MHYCIYLTVLVFIIQPRLYKHQYLMSSCVSLLCDCCPCHGDPLAVRPKCRASHRWFNLHFDSLRWPCDSTQSGNPQTIHTNSSFPWPQRPPFFTSIHKGKALAPEQTLQSPIPEQGAPDWIAIPLCVLVQKCWISQSGASCSHIRTHTYTRKS